MDKCTERKRWFLFKFLGSDIHHDFVDVYDTQKEEYIPDGTNLKNLNSSEIDAFKTKKYSSVYVKSVCKHCGKEIKR
jgi:hypothetical protein